MILEIWKKSNIVTFLGVMFAILGIWFCYKNLTDYSVIMLILAGICDAFDGPIAKKLDKTDKKYGVQLDSLADIISSGILPICICMAMGYTSVIDLVIYVIFVICGITRLSYYNINSSGEENFVGVPITFSAMLIPVIYLITKNEIVFMIALASLSFAFVTNIKIKKPTMKIKIVLSIIGVIISVYMILFEYFKVM